MMNDNPLNWHIDLGKRNKEADEVIRKKKLAQYEADLIYYNALMTDAGRQLLQFLRKNTIEAGTWLGSLPYEQAIAHGFAREGQNALVRNMEDAIKRIENAPNFEEYLNK